MKVVITGHRPEYFPAGGRRQFGILVRTALDWVVFQNPKDYYYIGMCRGWDIAFATACVIAGCKYEAVIPGSWQANKWSKEDKQLYNTLLAQANAVTDLGFDYPCTDAYMTRNQFMVDKSRKVVAAYDIGNWKSGTGATVRYAEKKDLQVVNLYPEIMESFDTILKI